MSFTASLEDVVAENFNGLLSKAAHWPRRRLGDLVSITNGAPLASSGFNTTTGVPVVRIRNVLHGDTDTRFDGPVDEAWYIEPGDLLIGMDGDFHAARWKGPRALLNQRVCVLRPTSSAITLQFLTLVLPGYLTAVNKHTPSITVKHLSSRTVADLPIPVPPRDEQDALVAAIETHFSRLDASVAALTRAKANVKRARASVLKAAVEGRLVPTEAALARAEGRDYEPAAVLLDRILAERRANHRGTGSTEKTGRGKYQEPVKPETEGLPGLPEGWVWASVQQLSAAEREPTYGVVKLGDATAGGVPVLRSSNVRALSLDLDFVKPVSPEIERQYARTRLRGGELLVTVRGTLGGVAVAPTACAGWNVSREVAVIALREPAAAPFVAVSLKSAVVEAWIARRLRGIAYTGLNIETLKQVPVPVPPMAEQHRIVAEVDRRLSVLDALDASIAANLARCARLRQAVLKRAFEGRLVPSDPTA